MRTEIGSEFWDVPLTVKENHVFDKATWFVSGRAAFRSILQQIKIENAGLKPLKAALPSYLCESMIEPLIKENIGYKYYAVTFENGFFRCDYSNIDDCNIIIVIDYFGYEALSNDFPRFGKTIIRDLTHSIFIKAYDDADYYFGSLRKWAGFLCGGFAWKKEGRLFKPTEVVNDYVALRKKAMVMKSDYIFEKTNSKDYLNIYQKAEDLLENCDIAINDSSDIKKAKYLDIEFIKKTRRNNAAILIDGLEDICLITSLNQNDCPLFVPIAINNRDKLKSFLIARDIYCPIHWAKPYKNRSVSDKLYEKELSLVCDQRYSTNDMRRIVSTIREFMEINKNA